MIPAAACSRKIASKWNRSRGSPGSALAEAVDPPFHQAVASDTAPPPQHPVRADKTPPE